MEKGVVLRGFSSYYYVQSGSTVYECKLRGRFKKERFSLLVGDRVIFSQQGEAQGMIEEILPRETLLTRPMVANVDQAVLTFAGKNPDISYALVDRFLVLAEHAQLDIVLCINKADLADPKELEKFTHRYQSIGYPVIIAAAKKGAGIEELRLRLKDRTTVFAGPSGAGKSTLLNAVQPGFALQTGEVSEKIGRGKHTTRFAQLLALDMGGFVVDTPGFSSIEFADIPAEDLSYYFPEMAEVLTRCKFSQCLHWKEPQCSVKSAVDNGTITTERYEHYLEFLAEIKDSKRGY
jgi:ribosome biogenesis GTPase